MNDLTVDQVAQLRRALETLKAGLEELLQTTRAATKPVDLNEPIGRLTRMDAIQQQGVSKANRHSSDLRLRPVLQAPGDMKRERYGICRRCEDSIGFPRLAARPESPYCLDCQHEVDRKHE